MDAMSDVDSDWSQVVTNDVLTRDGVLSLIADMRAEHEKQQNPHPRSRDLLGF